MSVSEYEKKFSELVRLVPYIQADEVLKCKRFLSGLQHQIRVHLSVVPQNRFGDLVEATQRVEQSTTAMYQSRQESKSKRSAPGTSQQSSGQYSRKKSKSKGYRGRGAGRVAISSQGSVRPPVASSGTQSLADKRLHDLVREAALVTDTENLNLSKHEWIHDNSPSLENSD